MTEPDGTNAIGRLVGLGRRLGAGWRQSCLSIIGRRVIVMIILFSSLITLLLSGFELSLAYTRDLSEIEERVEQIRIGQLDSIANDVWELNWDSLRQTLQGIANLPDIEFVEAVTDTGERIRNGILPAGETIDRDYALGYVSGDGELRTIGSLRIVATKANARERVLRRVGITLMNNGIKTFLVSLFALTLIRVLVTRRLDNLSELSRRVGITAENSADEFARYELPAKADELDQVEHALGQMVLRARQAYLELEQSETRFRMLVELSLDAILVHDRDQVLFANSAALALFGTDRVERLVGIDLLDLVSPGERAAARLQMRRVVRDKLKIHLAELPFRRFDGETIVTEVSAVPIAIDERSAAQIVLRDISERKHAEERLRQSAAVFESTDEGVFITDRDGRIIDANPALSEITGYERDTLLGENPRIWRSGQHGESFYRALWQSLLDGGRWRGEIWNRRRNGEAFPAWLTISEVRDDNDRLTHYVSVLSDISSIKDAEARLVHLAHHDSLTDLPNRMLFNDRVDHAISRARRTGEQLAMLFIDLDHFKNINDNFGHPAGDALLKLAAGRLQACIRSDATVARLGGDEFTILLEDIERPDDAALVADRILTAFLEPFPVENRELYISPSIGISIFPEDGESTGALLRNADAAMYKAKERGRKTYMFYTRQLTAHVAERVELEQSLHQALPRDELLLYYQPLVDLESGRLVGAEALMRWRYSERDIVSPARFVPLAEENGLIWSFGEWALNRACRQAVEWLTEGLAIERIAVNIAASQINRHDFTDLVRAALEDSGLPPQRLELEVTEGSFVGHTRSLESDLQALREMGVRIAIDDFGTGYSSMSQLKHLVVDCLKIDRSFISDIPADPYDKAIVKALVSMAQGLDLKLVAEGVESESQRRFLIRQGCRQGQGYLFGKPMPADEFRAWAGRNRAADGSGDDGDGTVVERSSAFRRD